MIEYREKSMIWPFSHLPQRHSFIHWENRDVFERISWKDNCNAGDRYTIRIKPNTSASSTIMVRTMKDSAIAANTIGLGSLNEIAFSLPYSGTFAIQVLSPDGSAFFDYSLGLYSSSADQYFSILSNPSPPKAFMLYADLPNPFKNSAHLRFAVPAIKNYASSKRKVFIAVYDLHGRLVRTLVNGFVPVGYHQITFDATNNSNNALGSGVLFCRMQAEGFVKSVKIVSSR